MNVAGRAALEGSAWVGVGRRSAARLVAFADRQPDQLSLPQVVDAILAHTWRAERDADPKAQALRRVTERVALDAMMILGGPVHGGRIYGRWPGLKPAQRFEGRDLAITTDFRDVFSEVITTHLGVRDLGPVFPGNEWAPQRRLGLVG